MSINKTQHELFTARQRKDELEAGAKRARYMASLIRTVELDLGVLPQPVGNERAIIQALRDHCAQMEVDLMGLQGTYIAASADYDPVISQLELARQVGGVERIAEHDAPKQDGLL